MVDYTFNEQLGSLVQLRVSGSETSHVSSSPSILKQILKQDSDYRLSLSSVIHELQTCLLKQVPGVVVKVPSL